MAGIARVPSSTKGLRVPMPDARGKVFEVEFVQQTAQPFFCFSTMLLKKSLHLHSMLSHKKTPELKLTMLSVLVRELDLYLT